MLTGLEKTRIRADPARAASDAAAHLGALVVLKGATTIIASPAGEMLVHEGGVPGLGTSGSGDVLAGLMAGLLARGARPIDAAAWAVYLHAAAGRLLTERVGALGFLARELAATIPKLIDELTPGSR